MRRRKWLALISASGICGLTSIASANWIAQIDQRGNKVPARRVGPVVIRVPGNAVAAIVGAVGGEHFRVELDAKLPPTRIVIGGGPSIDVAERILMKGEASARSRFLDDARNAVRLGINVRNALLRHDPKRQSIWKDNQRKWAHPFARKILAWTRRLEGGLKGRSIRDNYHRIYLLEWGGAKISNQGPLSPSGLAQLPSGPSVADLGSYSSYIDGLVGSIVARKP